MAVFEELVAASAAYDYVEGATAPTRQLLVLTCMDARIDVYRALGLAPGQAHVLRNAGGLVTDDVVRSVTVSQRALGTTAVAVIQHTGCGMSTLDEEQFVKQLAADTGVRPEWTVGAFSDLEASVRSGVRRLRAEVFLPHRDQVEGFVFDVATGRIHPVPTD